MDSSIEKSIGIMDSSSEKSTNGNPSKKIPLEALDKEELVRRCKNYLAIAQKAKAAKDDLQLRESELLIKLSALQEQVNENKVQSCKKCDDLQSENQLIHSKVKEVASQLKSKEEEYSSLISKHEALEAKLKSMEDNYGQQIEGFVEELNKMNVELKQRGETITRLEEQSQSNDKEFKAKFETLLQSIADRERKIEQLESEINRFETQSEMMSTSTVSKAEEIHRMKDVEDSLEDRYNKLKMLAIRMKKKIAEQQNQLATLESSNIRSIPINLQAFQKDIDRLNDELDSKKSEMKVLKVDCENAIRELALSKQAAEEYKNEASLLKLSVANLEKAKLSLEISVQDLTNQFENSQKELKSQTECNKIIQAEMVKECDTLKKEIRQLNGTIEDLTRSNQSAKLETKKHNLLEMEISDFEKSLAELTAQRDALLKDIEAKQNQIEQSSEERTGLLVQIQFMEQQNVTEQQRASESKKALDELQTQFDQYQNQVHKQNDEIKELNNKLESKHSEIDSLRMELSLANAELHKIQTGSSIQVESLRKQVAALEDATNVERTTNESLKVRISELQAEYDSYKIRAASVLKKQKTEGHSSAAIQKEGNGDFNTDQVEREMLQRLVEALKAKITELESQLALSTSEVSSLRSDKERVAAAQVVSAEEARQRLERAESELETVKTTYQAQISRLQGDNQLLAALHREQVDGIKIRHAQEILALQNQLDLAKLEEDKLQKLVSSNSSNRNTSPLFKDSMRYETSLVERERGEGSEDGSIHLRQNGDILTNDTSRKPMPLDMLLNSTGVSEESDAQIISSVSDSIPIEQHKEALLVLEKRCHHLASLLAESESNEARLSQLTDALKEEIRRTERAEERQKHIENLEYLKNVVLKFVTLPRGEERSRLVPVLTTLLRLSPAEVEEVHQSFSRSMEGVARPAWGGVFTYFGNQ